MTTKKIDIILNMIHALDYALGDDNPFHSYLDEMFNYYKSKL